MEKFLGIMGLLALIATGLTSYELIKKSSKEISNYSSITAILRDHPELKPDIIKALKDGKSTKSEESDLWFKVGKLNDSLHTIERDSVKSVLLKLK